MADLRETVATTARMIARAGLVEAFGHVSARGGEHTVITSVRPLATCRPEDTVVLSAAGEGVDGPVDELPLETPMHLAIYRARPDVGAICRGHPRAAVAWGTDMDDLPLLHGLGALAGERVRVHPAVDLVVDAPAGEAVAATLGADRAVLLRANGALALGADPLEAAVRLWFLEERARVAAAAPRSRSPVDEEAWEQRRRHTPAELRLAIAWFAAVHADPEERP